MSDAALWSAWGIWMGVAAVVVLIAAALLVYVWLTARAVLREAVRALHAVDAIHRHTGAIWALQTTNEVAASLAGRVEAIARKGAALVAALDGRPAGRHAE